MNMILDTHLNMPRAVYRGNHTMKVFTLRDQNQQHDPRFEVFGFHHCRQLCSHRKKSILCVKQKTRFQVHIWLQHNRQKLENQIFTLFFFVNPAAQVKSKSLFLSADSCLAALIVIVCKDAKCTFVNRVSLTFQCCPIKELN